MFPETVTQEELLQVINEKNADDGIDGVLVQLPVPAHISERAVCNAVAPQKDVDGFHVINVGRFCTDLKSLLPATPAGIMELLRRSGQCSPFPAMKRCYPVILFPIIRRLTA